MKLIIVMVLSILVGLSYLFIGVDKYIGDHEMGTSWQLFIKAKPSTQFIFSNPAQSGLDINQFNTLSKQEQDAFIFFCEIRYSTDNIIYCYKQIESKSI